MSQNQIAISTYEKIADVYTDMFYADKGDLPFFEKFCDRVPISGRVLDVGCGPGTFTQHLVKNGFETTGIDLSEKMLTIARENVPEANFINMDMQDLQLEDSSFDAVLAGYSLIHIEDAHIPNVLHEFFRVLGPNGVLGIMVQQGETDHVIKEPLSPQDDMFLNFFTTDRLRTFLEQAGFTIDLLYTVKSEQNIEEVLSDCFIYCLAKKSE